MHIPQVVHRQIGDVHIFDLKGELVGLWALKEKERLSSLLGARNVKKLIINLKGLDDIDSLGVKTITVNLPKRFKGGFMQGRSSVMQMFARMGKLESLRFFKSEDDVVRYFG